VVVLGVELELDILAGLPLVRGDELLERRVLFGIETLEP
jgi:hypothetical protein